MVIIAGGTVLDGTGAPRAVADVGIEGDSIATIGDLSALDGPRIAAAGRFVTPGFIDLHTHTDATILASPAMSSTVRQGVTTEVCGNCGMQVGLALCTPDFALEQRLFRGPDTFTWSTLGEFAALIRERGMAANLAFLVGHGTLRKRIMGWERGDPDGPTLDRMRAFLRQALDEGAFGLSTGLEYAPGSYATVDEVAALASDVAAVDGLYATHMRNEADALAQSVEEALAVARKSGVRLEISHLKVEGRRNWGTVQDVLRQLDAARAEGIDVTCDVYPYTAFMTGLAVAALPAWVQETPFEKIATELRDPAYRERVRAGVVQMGLDWEQLHIAMAPGDRSLQGRSVAEIARERGVAPEDAVLDVLTGEGGLVGAIVFAISEDDMRAVLQCETCSVASDGATRTACGPMAADHVHPRSFGTFPRVLGRYVREESLLSWEQAIRRMTGLPASRLRLRRRGVLQPGALADIVVFDPHTVGDAATYTEPACYPCGIEHVFVNGIQVVRAGEETGARPGRTLRRGDAE